MSTGLFSASGDEAAKRQVNCDFKAIQPVKENLEEIYEINRIVSWIKNLKVGKIALQFPDELLADGPDVALKIEQANNKVQVCILADTSYGSCCIDETTASHLNADAVVHFGKACLSQNRRLPVLYIFENLSVEIKPFLDSFYNTFTKNDFVVLAGEFKYHQSIQRIVSDLTSQSYQVAYLEPDLPSQTARKAYDDLNGFCLSVSGRICHIPGGKDILEKGSVLFMGEEGLTLTNLMFNLNSLIFFTYNPKTMILRRETLNVNQQLRKRYYLIEKAKDAKLIGILVATLGVADYLEIIEQLKKMITKAKKKFYTFVVGKLNPAKLANFPEIDCYVIIACPENSLQLDVKEFYRPVITPFELEVALNTARTWTGNYITDFRQLLPGSSGYVEYSSAENDQQTDVSLVSGRMRNLGFEDHLEECQNETSANKKNSEIVQQSNSHVSVLPSGSEYLKLNRGWSGLEPRIGETPVPCMATEGRRGIASGYVNETSEGNLDGDGHST